MSEWQIEMLWDCPVGPHRRIQGRHLNCTVCGRPKTENDDYYMPDDPTHVEHVVDEKQLEDAVAGPLWKCLFCGCRERRNDGDCANCGAGQGIADKEVIEVQNRVRFNAVNTPTQPSTTEDAPECSDDPQEAFAPRRGFHLRRFMGPLVGILGVAMLVVLVVWLFTPRTELVAVSSVHWDRRISIEHFEPVHQDGFSEQEPSDAYNVSSLGLRYHHTDHRRVGDHTEYYTVQVSCGQTCTPVPRVCSPNPQSCSTSCTSNKNGYATCRETCSGGGQSCSGGGQSCRTDYCDERRSKNVDDYQDFPISEPYYGWDVKRWVHKRDAVSSGDTLNVTWAATHLGDMEREKDHIEVFKVVFANKKGETWTQSPDNETEFERFVPQSRWTLKVDRLGSVHEYVVR